MNHSAKQKFPRAAALDAARDLCRRLKPVTDRLIVAGSLRRCKDQVGDVEILYVSKTEDRKLDLLSTAEASLAEEEIQRMLEDGTLAKRENRNGGTSWGRKNKFATHRASGIPVDLFRTTEACWFNYLVCRTGPKESNERIATAAQEHGYTWTPYGPGFRCQADNQVVTVASEAEVFAFVGIPYKEPKDR